jgi:hypothetical protein
VLRYAIGLIVIALLLATTAGGQDRPPIVFPPDATALEGTPTLRIDTTRESTTRRQLDAAEAAESRLRIRITDGAFVWSSRDDRRLTASAAGAFTYLASSEPGRYVRIQRLNDRLTYIEHLDTELGTVTYWGELRVVVGR